MCIRDRLPSALSVTAGQYVRQPASGSGINGIVKSTSNTTSVILIGVEGTFTTSADITLNGNGTSLTPSAVTVNYTDKPMFTSTIDGGSF